MCAHHAIADYTSVHRVVVDLALALSGGTLPPHERDVDELAARESARDPRWVEARKAFWRQELAQVPVLDLPTTGSRAEPPTHRGAQAEARVPTAVLRRLVALASAEGTTLHTVVLAAVHALLHRWTGQDDVVVGTALGTRDAPWAAELVGFLTTPLPIRAHPAPDRPFLELVREVRDASVRAMAHALPLPEVVEALGGRREDPIRAMVTLERAPGALSEGILVPEPGRTLRLAHLEAEPLPIRPRDVPFDLGVLFEQTVRGLAVAVQVATDVLDPGAAGRFADHLLRLLDAASAEPTRALRELPILGPDEARALLHDMQPPPTPLPDRPAHVLFADVASRIPDEIALVDGTREWTYRALARAAFGVAHALREAGVGPDVRVGVCLERRGELVIAVLGAMLAGGAYVHLDPTYPTDRLGWMIADADVAVVVSGSEVVRRPPGTARWLDVDVPPADAPPDVPELLPDHLAYVIYTSGSTGRPKGVAIEHRSLSAFVGWVLEAFTRDELRGTLLGASLSFDMSVMELFAPLCGGGTAILAPSALDLPALPARERVRTVIAVPSVVAELVAGAGLPTSVRVVGLGAEVVTPALAEALLALPHVERVVNLYGPTEDTVCCTMDVLARGVRPTLGRSLSNRVADVLDPDRRPQPLGGAGEIWLGGPGLARGYLGRPELTAERFVEGLPGLPERLYATGDLGRRLPDGRIEFLGRRDHLVKVRGFRVDLDEVRAVLAAEPGVIDAVVLADEAQRLRAFVLGPMVAPDALRQVLMERLPAHLVPNTLRVVETFPRLPSGKVDRRALLARPEDPAVGAAPMSEREREVAEVFASVLGVAVSGPEDDFFSLGGHSLLGSRMLARLSARFGVQLPLRALFDAPSIRALAARIEAAAPAVADAPANVDGDAPLSSGQRRLWFLHCLDPSDTAYNVTGILALEGPIDPETLRAALRRVAHRHEILRTTVRTALGEALQHRCEAVQIPLDVDRAPGPWSERARAHAEALAARPFDLTRDPGLRAVWVDGGERGALVLCSTHFAIDGSVGILLAEMETAYADELAGAPAAPPELGFAAVAADEQRRQREVVARHLPYWRARLDGRRRVLDLPTDRPRPPVASGRGATAPIVVPPELAGRIRAAARAARTTVHNWLLTVFAATLHRWSGQTDLPIGSPVEVRPPGAEGVLGNFVNPVVLSIDAAGAPTFRQLLARVTDTVLEAHEHAQLPFDLLVEALAPGRDRSRTPLFQAMFVHVAPPPAPRFGETGSSFVDWAPPTARFDLLWGTRDRDDGGIGGSVEYAADLFDPATIERWVAAFVRLATAAVDDAERPIDRLPVLAPEERRRILVDWNATAAPVPGPLTLHGRFEARVDANPDAVAILCGSATRTYGEVEARANRWAHLLRGRGIGPGSRVAFRAGRRLECAEILLGILKAGAAYAPIPANVPAARARFVVADAGAALVITEAGVDDRYPPEVGLIALDDDELAARLADAPPTRLAGGPHDPDAEAYLISTSGSTGTPKGVRVRHRPAVNLLDWVNGEFGVGPDDRLLFVTSYGFDLSVYDLFGVLAAGGSIRVAEASDLRDPDRLWSLLERDGITFWDSAPATLLQLGPHLDRARGTTPASRLRRVFLSGDWVPLGIADRVRAVWPAAEVIALGGATEAVIWSNFHRIGEVCPTWRSIPYGRPIRNARYYVLDAHLEPCPVGVPGDLYIGGPVLADGYTDPALTRARFVPDPHAGEADAVMYRTGDRARFWADGSSSAASTRR
ncbi:MAG: amino acid adenylation domain-containing protein [Myxococcota bacterium]